MKVTIPIEINVKCRSNCSKCKWGLKPSACAPWDDAVLEQKNVLHYNILKAADKYFGVENKIVEDDDFEGNGTIIVSVEQHLS